MFRNHKELVDFWKVRNLFEELSSLDNDVDCSLREIANFHFNIKHPKSFDKAYHDLDETVGDPSCKNSKNLHQSAFRRQSFNPLRAVKEPFEHLQEFFRLKISRM
jgi:hypothetical protein